MLNKKEIVVGLPKIQKVSFYDGCIYGKQNKKSFPTSKASRALIPLELVYADLCGPMTVESLVGSPYFLLFIDDYNDMCWVYFLKNKHEAFEYFKKCKSLMEKQI